jgi:hypothetical protein
MSVINKKLSKAMKHFEHREIKPKEYVPQPPKQSSITKIPEPILIVANKGGYHLKEYVLFTDTDGKTRYTGITSQNVSLAVVTREHKWTPEFLNQKLVQAKKARAAKNSELQETISKYVETGALTQQKADTFLDQYHRGELNEMEEDYFLERCEDKMTRRDNDFAKLQEEMVRDQARAVKEQERLEKYRADWTPKTKTVAKVYEALKTNRDRENVAELNYDTLMAQTGIGSRSTIAKAIAELKDAERITAFTQYHRPNGYYIRD